MSASATRKYRTDWIRMDRKKNPEKYRIRMRRWLSKPENREKKKRYDALHSKERYERYVARKRSNPEAYKAYLFKRNLWVKYRLTVEQYDEMVFLQGGLCAICKLLPSPKRRLGVDHNHVSGENRGLLCHICNMALHKMEKKIQWANDAREYLESYTRVKH